MKSKKKKKNKKTTQKLFEERTGVKYENWIQAWGVTEQLKNKVVEIVVPYRTKTTTQSYSTGSSTLSDSYFDITGLNAAANVAGAGASISLDLFDGAAQFAYGEYGEGAKNFARNLPFARMWFWKDDMNAITRMWAQ